MSSRTLAWIVLLALALPVALVAVINVTAGPAPELEPPDPDMEITVGAEGRVVTLAELTERFVEDSALSPDAEEPSDATQRAEEEESPPALTPILTVWPDPERAAREGDLVQLGRYALREGRVEEALALWRSVPRGHEDWARAQRFIGYEIYGKALDEPRKGVAYVNRALAAQPFEGNSWQDLGRVYAQSLGLSFD